MGRKAKEKRGITLIALVVTIVLVLALKTPTVNFLAGSALANNISTKIAENVNIPQGGGVDIAETLNLPEFIQSDMTNQIDIAFVSPSTTGVKLLVPYRLSPKASIEESFDKARLSAWEYLKWKYGLNADASNADLSRACFLCHDPSAKLRES